MPYKTYTDQYGYHFFYTATEQQYYFLFRDVTSLTPILGVYDIHVYEFQFFPSPTNEIDSGAKYSYDSKVAETIVSTLQVFFNIKDRVVLYLCDSSDGKHKARQRLFNHWHRAFPNTIINVPLFFAETIDDFSYETCGNVMYQEGMENQKLIQDYLIDKALDILIEKYEP